MRQTPKSGRLRRKDADVARAERLFLKEQTSKFLKGASIEIDTSLSKPKQVLHETLRIFTHKFSPPIASSELRSLLKYSDRNHNHREFKQ